jgi:GNAT superfamily N-acetyltransferase
MVAEIGALYGGLGKGPTATPSELSPPDGAFVVVWEDGRPVAGGGVKRLAPGLAEIKRMYVVPDARGRGHARRLLTALEDAARALGYDRVRLDTGPQQPHARALYDSAGYVEIPDYNENSRASYWGEKDLSAVDGAPAPALPMRGRSSPR